MSSEFNRGDRKELSINELVSRLDMGTKEIKGNKLYLAEREGTIFGLVEFTLEDHYIIGSDGIKFDLLNMQYHGPKGIYTYMRAIEKRRELGPSVDDKNTQEEVLN